MTYQDPDPYVVFASPLSVQGIEKIRDLLQGGGGSHGENQVPLFFHPTGTKDLEASAAKEYYVSCDSDGTGTGTGSGSSSSTSSLNVFDSPTVILACQWILYFIVFVALFYGLKVGLQKLDSTSTSTSKN
jgi:hypothetical protein